MWMPLWKWMVCPKMVQLQPLWSAFHPFRVVLRGLGPSWHIAKPTNVSFNLEPGNSGNRYRSATVKDAKNSWRSCSFLTNNSATNRCRRAFSLSRYAAWLDSSLVIASQSKREPPLSPFPTATYLHTTCPLFPFVSSRCVAHKRREPLCKYCQRGPSTLNVLARTYSPIVVVRSTLCFGCVSRLGVANFSYWIVRST
jgi:hypothetical protein